MAQTAASPEMAAAMERYGMIPPVTIYVEKQPDRRMGARLAPRS